MKKFLFIALLGFTFYTVQAQKLTLADCLNKARMHNPVGNNRDLALKIEEARKKIIKSAWLPGMDLNAQATWQSDVVSFTLDLPFPVDFPAIPRDQYKATLDVSQLLYDGGNTKALRKIEEINARLAGAEVDVKDQSLSEVVEELYFTAILLNKRLEILGTMTGSLDETLKQVRAGITNGVLSESDFNSLMAEKIRIEQQSIQIKALRTKTFNALSIFTGTEIGEAPEMQIPQDPVNLKIQPIRPELSLFAMQQELADARITQLNGQLRPKLAAFGQAGYGKPGLNFLGDSWEPYLVIGMRFSWNFWDWSRTKNQKEILSIGKSQIQNQKALYDQQLSLLTTNQLSTIDELKSLLMKDIELIQTREKVTAAYHKKLMGGLINASMYLTEWTKEQEARITKESRDIELLGSKYKFLIINGKTL
jgi:outer membrane protein TolC